MAASSVSLYLLHPPSPPLTFKPKSRISSLKTITNPSLQINSSSSFSSKGINFNPNPLHKNTQIWRISATSEEIVSSTATTTTTANPVEDVQQLTASEDGSGISTIISVLLFIAFVGLSILTAGVIYIAVTDFLTKREAEKFEKEEAAKMKKGGKKKKKVVRAKNGPRGFGQKLVEEEDFDDDDDA